jgi:hypothetical protein
MSEYETKKAVLAGLYARLDQKVWAKIKEIKLWIEGYEASLADQEQRAAATAPPTKHRTRQMYHDRVGNRVNSYNAVYEQIELAGDGEKLSIGMIRKRIEDRYGCKMNKVTIYRKLAQLCSEGFAKNAGTSKNGLYVQKKEA